MSVETAVLPRTQAPTWPEQVGMVEGKNGKVGCSWRALGCNWGGPGQAPLLPASVSSAIKRG